MQQRLIDSLWCLCLSIYILMGLGNVPLHGDESSLIFMGRDFYYHIQGDTSQVYFADWETLSGEAATEQQLRLANGTVNKYLYGAIAYFSGYTFDEINQQWAWGSGWDWNHENGHVPSDDLLYLNRFVSASLLAISAIAIFALGYAIAGQHVAYFASAYYALNPAILLNGRRAMMESGMLAFTILAVLITVYLLKNRFWWHYVLLGLFSGLAVASKHTAVITIFIIFAVCGVYFLLNKHQRVQSLARLFTAGLVSILVFFVLNPAWWSNPIGAANAVLDLRQDLLSGQVGFYGGYENFTQQVIGFSRQSFVVLPMHAESDTDGFYSQQLAEIEQYDKSLLSGVSIGGSWFGASIIFILCGIGFLRLWLCETIDKSIAGLMTTWLIGMVLLTLLITPLEWQRYYIPIYPVVGILGAIGLNFSLKTVMQWQNKQKAV